MMIYITRINNERIPMNKHAKLLLLASSLTSGKIKVASSREQRAVASLIVRTAMDVQAFGAAGPLVAQQFIIGAVSFFDDTVIGRANQRKHALASLKTKFPKLRDRENEANLKKIEDKISEFLQKKFSALAKQFGADALEEAYTKLVLDQPVYKWADKNNTNITTTSIDLLIKEIQKALSTIIRGDILDALRKYKKEQELSEQAGGGLNTDFDYVDLESDGLLSQRAPTSLAPELRNHLLSVVDEVDFVDAAEAMRTLKVSSISSARLFAEAVRGCGIFANPSKIPSSVREDLAVAAVVLPYTLGFDGESSRGAKYQAIVDYFLNSVNKTDPNYQDKVAENVKYTFTSSGVSALNAEGVASYMISAKFAADRMEAYVDQAYIDLVKKLIKVETNLDQNAVSGNCLKALSAISNAKELAKMKYKMDAHSIDFQNR